MSVLDAHGISHDEAARHVGLSPTTLTAYARGYCTAAHRTTSAATLDRLRDLAVEGYVRQRLRTVLMLPATIPSISSRSGMQWIRWDS